MGKLGRGVNEETCPRSHPSGKQALVHAVWPKGPCPYPSCHPSRAGGEWGQGEKRDGHWWKWMAGASKGKEQLIRWVINSQRAAAPRHVV